MQRNGDFKRYVEKKTKGLGAACERLVIIKFLQKRAEELNERPPRHESKVLLDVAQFIQNRFRET